MLHSFFCTKGGRTYGRTGWLCNSLRCSSQLKRCLYCYRKDLFNIMMIISVFAFNFQFSKIYFCIVNLYTEYQESWLVNWSNFKPSFLYSRYPINILTFGLLALNINLILTFQGVLSFLLLFFLFNNYGLKILSI